MPAFPATPPVPPDGRWRSTSWPYASKHAATDSSEGRSVIARQVRRDLTDMSPALGGGGALLALPVSSAHTPRMSRSAPILASGADINPGIDRVWCYVRLTPT